MLNSARCQLQPRSPTSQSDGAVASAVFNVIAGLAGAAALSALLALGAPPSYASASPGLREEVSLPPIPTAFPPLPDLRAPNIEQAVLPNGLRIFMMEDHEVPLVKASLVMRGGMRASPPDKVLSGPWFIYLCVVLRDGMQTDVAGLPFSAVRCLHAFLALAFSHKTQRCLHCSRVRWFKILL